jgi:tripartite-type tricarboxylate transporter receptor subunit TctC
VLSEAAPDGTTLGIVNLPGLLMTAMTDASTFHPLDELVMLGTIGRARHVWSAGGATPIRSAEQLLEAGRNRALVFGMNSFSSLGFLNAAIPCALLGLRAEFVSGYGGSSETMMAAIRGDVDLVSLSWDTQIDSVQSGDLRPLLRIAGAGPAEDELFEGLPALGGPKGLAAAKGASVVEDAEALVRFTGVGRVAASPRGLPADLERCLAEAICASLSDPGLARAAAQARMGLEPACAAVTVEEARAVRADVGRLETIVREAIKRVRA